jgi:hypothetical protein
MKPLLTITLLLAVCLWAGCDRQPQQNTNTEITVILDRTDSLRNYPTATDLLHPLALQHDKWQGVRITLTSISDKDLNNRVVLQLPHQSEWSGNIVERGAAIQYFTKTVQHSLDSMRNAPTCTHSIVYRIIAREANSLAISPATNRYLLVYSNLYENSAGLNFYSPPFMRELKQAPDKVEQRMLKSTPLGSMANVQLYLLYNPASFADNNMFMPIAGMYRHLFESHRARVHVATQFALP